MKKIERIIGWVIILCGVAYALFGTTHSDTARFLACCVCLGGGLTILDNRDSVSEDK